MKRTQELRPVARLWLVFCLLSGAAMAEESFKDRVGPISVAPVQQMSPLQVPFIVWGGDMATFYANGGLSTKPGTIFAQQGLSLSLTPGDDFHQQVRDYLSGKSPFLRGTFRMMGMASEVISSDPRTKGVVIMQMTWSAGDHMIARPNVKEELTQAAVVGKVEEYIQSQLGEDIVEFKKPAHTLRDVIGFSRLKEFIASEMLPRLGRDGEDALPGAAVCGPIGGGKTFIFEAMASELNMVVLVLKNIRSQWFGQTDVLFERLRRVLEALSHVLIFVDEADTQFGGVGAGEHSTERRLTGKIQAMMSDSRLRGRVTWLLMTARIHLLSPDIRRPGRVGDLIIPVLDPEGEDRREFLAWAIRPAQKEAPDAAAMEQLDALTRDWAAANFAALRSELKARARQQGGPLEVVDILAMVQDLLPPAIGPVRRYQALQALVNCTRRSLLPDPSVSDEERAAWGDEIRVLERRGIG